jgi:hypothetical protein
VARSTSATVTARPEVGTEDERVTCLDAAGAGGRGIAWSRRGVGVQHQSGVDAHLLLHRGEVRPIFRPTRWRRPGSVDDPLDS